MVSIPALPSATPVGSGEVPYQPASGATARVRLDTLPAALNLPLKGLTRYYVDYTNGNDSNDGLSAGTAKKNLSAAVGSSRDIIVAPGFIQLAGTVTFNNITNCVVRGAGIGTQFVVNGNYDAIAITGFSYQCDFRDFSIVSFVARSSGAGINATATSTSLPHYRLNFNNILVQNTYSGMVVDTVQQSRWNNVRVECTSVGFMPGNGWTITRGVSLRFSHCTATSINSSHMGGYAKLLDSDCDTVTITGGEYARSALDCLALRNTLTTAAGHTGPRLVRITDTYTEASSAGNGLGIYSARDLRVTNLCTDQNALHGILAAGGTSISLISPWSALNQQHGIAVTGSGGDDPLVQVDIVSPDCLVNSQATNVTYDGISVTASGTPVTIIGGRSGDHLYTVTNHQRYGLDIGASTDYVSVMGLNLSGNTTDPIRDQSTGLNNDVRVAYSGWRLPYTFRPELLGGYTAAGASNDAYFFRATGSGKISKIAMQVNVQSGNISVGVCRGLPGGNAPTTRIATSGASPVLPPGIKRCH
jgi:hypothetical protein